MLLVRVVQSTFWKIWLVVALLDGAAGSRKGRGLLAGMLRVRMSASAASVSVHLCLSVRRVRLAILT